MCAVQAVRGSVDIDWTADVLRAAAYDHAAVKTAQPFQTLIVSRSWRSDSAKGVPGERLAKKFGIGNVEPAIDYDFVAKSAAGIDPSDANAVAWSIVECRSFDPAEL